MKPMPTEYEQELAVALRAVHQAMQACRNVQRAITAETLEKHDKSPVTVADFASQAIVCRVLGEDFPDDPMIAEEDSAALRAPEQAAFLERVCEELRRVGVEATPEDACGWIDRGNLHEHRERFWTLDPIDGTKGFLRGEQYAVSLALLIDGHITVAALGCPNLPHEGGTGVVFTAVRGHGAMAHSFEGDSSAAGKPIHVRDTTDPAQATFCESVENRHSHQDWAARIAEALGITAEPVRMDSQAKYAAVARGDAEIYLRLPTKPGYREKIWDHAGGVLVVTEAGGTVTDIDGQPLDFTRGPELSENRGVIVSNGRFHERILQAVRETRDH
jgi:3'(2'), 5'-bisphosphate nucleotidase